MDDLDRWTRVMPLGTGAFGEVHLAWDRLDGRWVALKRFTGQDELGLLRMVIESRIRVSHPHLVRTVAFRLVDDRAWLVTELARGGSLRTLMTRTGVLPWGWVAEAVDQVLAALTALHATGVVHRDLKPANLLLRSVGTEPPHLLVGDFGIATWRTVSMTGIGAAIGTPGYLAPEYLDGHQPSPATDVFAVGVLAAELLTGQRLVHYSNASPTMPSTWSDVLPVPPEVPRALAAVLQRMADPNPDRRYRDSTQAREALLSAVPPAVRPTLPVVVSDLLANLPPGWTEEGPEPSTALLTPATSALDATQQAATPQHATATPEPNPALRPDPPSPPLPSVPSLSPAASPSSVPPATASAPPVSASPATAPPATASSALASPATASSSTPRPTAPSAATSTPSLTALPIDGGPTALILENKTASNQTPQSPRQQQHHPRRQVAHPVVHSVAHPLSSAPHQLAHPLIHPLAHPLPPPPHQPAHPPIHPLAHPLQLVARPPQPTPMPGAKPRRKPEPADDERPNEPSSSSF